MESSAPIPHGYYPLGVELPHFTVNEDSTISLISRFGVQWASVVGLSFYLIGRLRPTASRADKVAFTWMCLSIFYPACP